MCASDTRVGPLVALRYLTHTLSAFEGLASCGRPVMATMLVCRRHTRVDALKAGPRETYGIVTPVLLPTLLEWVGCVHLTAC